MGATTFHKGFRRKRATPSRLKSRHSRVGGQTKAIHFDAFISSWCMTNDDFEQEESDRAKNDESRDLRRAEPDLAG